MSGRKQHYIPQSFQRPFKIGGDVKGERIWCYRKDKNRALNVRIADVAAERDFYSSPSSSNEHTLDDLITKYESKLADKLRALNSFEHGEHVPSDVAAEAISHLTYRAKTIRNLASFGLNTLVSGVVDSLGSNFNLENFPAAPIPEVIKSHLVASTSDFPNIDTLNLRDDTLLKIVYAVLRENPDQYLNGIKEVLEGLSKAVENFDVQNAHTTSFDRMFPEALYDQLADIKWQIIGISEGSIVLPDCIGVYLDQGGNFYPLLGGVKSARMILVPLSPDKLLVGSLDDNFLITAALFNVKAAECSSEFFLSKFKNENTDRLQSRIGERIFAQIRSVVDGAFQTFRVSEEHSIDVSSTYDIESLGEYQISLTIPDGATESLSKSQIKDLAIEIVSVWDRETLQKVEHLTFGDTRNAARTYAETTLPRDLIEGSISLRSDDVCAILPSQKSLGEFDVHINWNVVYLFLQSETKAEAIGYLKSAEADVSLHSLADCYEAGGYRVDTQHSLVHAIHTLRIYSRIVAKGGTSQSAMPKVIEDTRDVLIQAWDINDLNRLEKRHELPEGALAELTQRMAYSMVCLGNFVAKARASLPRNAMKLCPDRAFVRWACLFEKDMQVAMRWLGTQRPDDAGLILAAHFERLMAGLGFVFEIDADGNLRWEYREHLASGLLKVPFEALIEQSQRR